MSPHLVVSPLSLDGRFYLSHKLDRVWIAVELLDTGTSQGVQIAPAASVCD
jgi:hypothetical protein